MVFNSLRQSNCSGLGLETCGLGLGLGLPTFGLGLANTGLGLGLERTGLGLGLGLATAGLDYKTDCMFFMHDHNLWCRRPSLN